jgi:hypothetical protein
MIERNAPIARDSALQWHQPVTAYIRVRSLPPRSAPMAAAYVFDFGKRLAAVRQREAQLAQA